MTTLDERPVTAPVATPADIAAYATAAKAHARTHPANGTGAIAAGISAVLANRERHPASTVVDGLQVTDQWAEVVNLRKCGWRLVGLGMHRDTGDDLWVLERAERGSGT